MRKYIKGLQGFAVCALALCSLNTIAIADNHSSRLDQMASPIIDPVNFEDPRIQSEARLIYLNHELDDDFATGGGNIQIVALQLRYALNDRWALVANKDGYVWVDPDNEIPGVVEEEDGIGNIGGGVKYAFYMDSDAIMSAHLRYEFPVGDDEVLQGEGDGVLQPAVSAAYGLCGNSTLMWSAGFRLPIDDEDSTFFDADLHWDYRIDTGAGAFYPNLEANIIHVVDGGERLGIADEGQDYFNLGASEADGKTIVVGGVGARYRFTHDLDVGASYQVPLTSGSGSNIIDWRVITDLIYRF